MEYTAVTGFNGGNLFYIPEEKHLYVRKTTKNGTVHLVCYDTVETAKTKKSDPSFIECAARCHLKGDQLSRTNSTHRHHANHELAFKDLVSLNAMKDHCRYLAKHFPFSAHKIPVSEIFYVEMAK